MAQGILWGAVLGVAVLALEALVSGWPLLLLFAPVAAIVGAAWGGIDGLVAGVVLMLARPAAQRDLRRARLTGGGAAAAPPLVLVFLSLGDGHLGGWAWWLFVAVLACAAGAVLAPRVVHGEPRRQSSGARSSGGVEQDAYLGNFA